MYAIAQVIYGLPLVAGDNTSSPRDNPLIDQAIEEETEGFLSYYSGAADESPAAFGVELGGFDEACAYVEVSDLPLAPTDQHKQGYQDLLAGLDAELRDAIQTLGEPRVFFLWSTS